MDGWVWSNGGMILTGENWSTGRKTLLSMGGRWMDEYGAMVEWYWQGKTEVLAEKHYWVWVVDGWMSMEQWWYDTDRAKLQVPWKIPIPVPFCRPQIQQELPWDWTQAWYNMYDTASVAWGSRMKSHSHLHCCTSCMGSRCPIQSHCHSMGKKTNVWSCHGAWHSQGIYPHCHLTDAAARHCIEQTSTRSLQWCRSHLMKPSIRTHSQWPEITHHSTDTFTCGFTKATDCLKLGN